MNFTTDFNEQEVGRFLQKVAAMGNLPNEVPLYVYSVAFCQPLRVGPGYWLVEERPILESADTWIVVGSIGAPGIVKLDRMELDLDGMTVVDDRIFYATRERRSTVC